MWGNLEAVFGSAFVVEKTLIQYWLRHFAWILKGLIPAKVKVLTDCFVWCLIRQKDRVTLYSQWPFLFYSTLVHFLMYLFLNIPKR